MDLGILKCFTDENDKNYLKDKLENIFPIDNSDEILSYFLKQFCQKWSTVYKNKELNDNNNNSFVGRAQENV